MGHHHHHNTSDGGVSHQRVNSPRFTGSMTRRAHSFKRNNTHNNSNEINTNASGSSFSTHHEIDVPLNSPRSEIGPSSGSCDTSEFKQQVGNHASQRVHLRSLLKKPVVGSVVLELGFREKKKLGHWMFLVFCGVCLFLGVFKICVNGWFGSAIEKAASNQVALPLLFISVCWCGCFSSYVSISIRNKKKFFIECYM